MKTYKKIIFGLIAIIGFGFAQQSIGAVLNSNQVGTNPSSGLYLQTNGATSTWATVAGASSTNVFGINGVSVIQIGVNATASLNTTYAAIWTALETFSNGLTANGTVTLGSTTNAIAVTNSSGQVLAFAGSNPCVSGQAAFSISATGTIGCTSVVTSTLGNWIGTWQGVNSSTFYLASNPNGYISGNQTITLTGAVTGSGATTIATTITSPLNLSIINASTSNITNLTTTQATTTNLTVTSVTGTQCLHAIGGVVSGTGLDCGSGGGSGTTTINGVTSSTFHIIGDGLTITSTLSGATTTFSVINGTYLTPASGTALYYPITNPSGYTSSTGTLASTTPWSTGDLTVVSSSGALAGYTATSCAAGMAFTGLSATGTPTCSTFATSTTGSASTLLEEDAVGTVNGSNVTFTTSHTPTFIAVGGQTMINGDGFSLSGLTETFTNAPLQTPHSFYTAGAGSLINATSGFVQVNASGTVSVSTKAFVVGSKTGSSYNCANSVATDVDSTNLSVILQGSVGDGFAMWEGAQSNYTNTTNASYFMGISDITNGVSMMANTGSGGTNRTNFSVSGFVIYYPISFPATIRLQCYEQITSNPYTLNNSTSSASTTMKIDYGNLNILTPTSTFTLPTYPFMSIEPI